MANITNATLWDSIRASFPQFASVTSKATNDLFTERGYEKLNNTNPNIIQDFFLLSTRVWLNIINISHAKDDLESNGFGEFYDQPFGSVIQRMAIDTVKPVSPAYKNLKDGDSPDQFVVRKPKTSERMFVQNFDFQSVITVPDDFAMKQIFINQYGMSEFMAGVMESLQNGYTVQRYENKLEALNAGINSTNNPLKDTQKMDIVMAGDAPTEAEAKDIILAINNLVEAMTMGPQNSSFNAMGFMSTQDKSRLCMLVRPGFKNALKVLTMSGAFHPEYLGIDVDKIITVPHFGGLVPTSNGNTQVHPVYDALGTIIGYNTQKDATEVTIQIADVKWKDPNSSLYAVVADRGYLFECRQNGYEVEPARNVRGKYVNLWASSANNTVAVDALYNIVAIYKAGGSKSTK